MQRYGIWSLRDKQDLLLRVDVEDFCHAIAANDGSVLYVFCLDTYLVLEGSGRRRVRIYIKHNYPAPGTKRDVVISLHALERPIVLPFRD